MSADRLEQIKKLQYTDRTAAEALALAFIREVYSAAVVQVELRPLAVSLNSFNGYLTLDSGRRLFFKTHTEADTVIGEYYQAGLLADAGYPVIRPIFSSTEVGKQLLIYELIESPSVFDVAWAIENGDAALLPALTQAQQQADDQLFALYEQTLEFQTAQEAAKAPIHQLFYHRLVGGRLSRFYGESPDQPEKTTTILLPNGVHNMHVVRRVKWQINGQQYQETLEQLITKAVALLNPAQPGPAVIGHGDAHNGNVFLDHAAQPPSLSYFDPAFAGHHHPLLDLAKPLFHNIFAMWMYFPHEKQRTSRVSLMVDGDTWRVEYDYALPDVRLMFLRSKIDRVLIPTLRMLKTRNLLREDWRKFLKATLFCCPFLTMNLTDSERFPPEISLLGLAMAVEMGAESHTQRSLIDQVLNEAAAHIH